ncbi:hypothetical protein [Streptomyces sp. NPDC058653]|uniref:hypothetical protein n=1 Tax=Streptomyces sp. NPDC058653 TaxID=3346576 RepID=UPI00365F7ACD
MSHTLITRRPIASRTLAAAASVDKGVLYSTISAGMVLARRYLTGRGVDQSFADRYGSPFGRTAAKIYRSETGAEPRKAWSNVGGKWRRVNGFLPTETPVLDKAFVTYRRTAEYVTPAEPPAAEVYVNAAGDFPSRFEPVTGDYLRAIERAGGTEQASEEMERLLAELADWRRHLDRYEATVTDADESAVQGLPDTHPARIAWRAASTGIDAWLRAREATHAAYVDWSFDLTGTVEVEDSPRPEPVVVKDGCRVPGCDSYSHYENTCTATLAELKFDDGSSLPIDLVAIEGEPTYVVAWAYETGRELHRKMTDPADVRAMAATLRDAADALDDASTFLATA